MNRVEKSKTNPEDLMCQDCVLEEIGAGKDICDKHGKAQIDWKCMFCCSTALFHCFGTHFMCNQCHEDYMRKYHYSNPPVKDCHGIDCPLGIAHPPPSQNPREGGCFSLGCGICRSEKTDILKNRDIKQVITANTKLPKAYIYDARKPMKGVVYPEVVLEMPDFVALAEELLEAELEAKRQAELERIRILNSRPVAILNSRQLAKKERQVKRKLQNNIGDGLPAWFLNPLNEDDEYELEKQEAERIALEQVRLTQEAKQIALENEKAMKEMKRNTLKAICSQVPKKTRVLRRRK